MTVRITTPRQRIPSPSRKDEMKKEDVITTKVHYEGPYYRTKYFPHYVVHVEKLCDDFYATTWAYNAWGAVHHEVIKIEDLEPYNQTYKEDKK